MARIPGKLRTVVVSLLGLALLPASSLAAARALSFPDRVAAQEAIERVYHGHRREAPPFEEAVSVGLLESKVRRALQQTAALERYWGNRITAEALQAEMRRIARGSQLPERLVEIYHALDDDPFLVQETFVRQNLVERLTRDFYAFDPRFHRDARDDAESARRWMARGRFPVDPNDPQWTVIEVVRRTGLERDPAAPGLLRLDPEEFEARRGRAPERVGEIGPLVEDRDWFSIEVLLDEDDGRMKLASYAVPKRPFEDWWDEASAELEGIEIDPVASGSAALLLPSNLEAGEACGGVENWNNGILDDIPEPRYAHSTVWTGSEMIVFGGIGTTPFINSGGRYDPLTNTWLPITKVGAPSPRRSHTAVWSGSEMIVWGGNANPETSTGGRYNPTTDSWVPVSLVGAPSPRVGHTAIWTGTEMIVWAGSNNSFALITGGRYNPGSDSWTPTTLVGVPAGRHAHTAIWTGGLMVVWGGDSGGPTNTGGRYSPQLDQWIATSVEGVVPLPRSGHSAVWTGTEMIVWGGVRGPDLWDSGGRYDPVTDVWTTITRLGAPAGRRDHTAVWTGTKMIIWGGAAGTNLSSGGEWNPATDSWTNTPLTGAPPGRSQHDAIWTGNLMVIWGGSLDGDLNTSGGRYDPDIDQWTPTATANGQGGRKDHTAVWTGSEMVVWGGFDSPPPTYLSTGGRYDPVVDDWVATTVVGAPSGRELHFSVWTGTEVLVWGGFNGASYLSTGGRYNPISDSWIPMSNTNAPSIRQGPSGIWTGSELIVWGGFQSQVYFNDGRRYHPGTDTWTTMSQVGAPEKRFFHSAVWTGSEMIVWGGGTSLGVAQDGSRYNPSTDAWTPLAGVGAPAARNRHTAVWTGTQLIVWAGFDGTYRQDGGVYDLGSNTWTSMTLSGAPGPRIDHTAVWTGSEMLIWGGFNGTSAPYLGSGGRYDPAANTWQSITLDEAPSPRNDHSAVWIDDRMVIWGGSDGSVLNTGGRYAVGDLPPGEASNLQLTDSVTLQWSVAPGGGVVHDVARGLVTQLPVGAGLSEVCLVQGAGTTTTDVDIPPVGGAFWYLPRGVNGCGTGTYGNDGSGFERITFICP